MRAHIGRWGNSLALRLPKELAEAMQIGEGATVDIAVEAGVLKVVPAKPRYRLADLVKSIKPGNIPDESFDDGPKGRERI